MPYVVRNKDKHIMALLREAPHDNAEFLGPDHPEVAAFIAETDIHGARQALAETDLEITRVIEDLVQLLIHKNTIMFTELPPAVQLKLLNREKLRNSLQTPESNLWDDEEGLI
ncbi:MAG: hypothetical protein AseanaTS_14720 [Candidatus Pelagadaptatus aseana]|uniref:hypothetical protein n=1 Tax=Candidatus Pelagadaptatus aseana TaxID=3120508 RepID=UPI0039B27F69